jgi:hypothetical protein
MRGHSNDARAEHPEARSSLARQWAKPTPAGRSPAGRRGRGPERTACHLAAVLASRAATPGPQRRGHQRRGHQRCGHQRRGHQGRARQERASEGGRQGAGVRARASEARAPGTWASGAWASGAWASGAGSARACDPPFVPPVPRPGAQKRAAPPGPKPRTPYGPRPPRRGETHCEFSPSRVPSRPPVRAAAGRPRPATPRFRWRGPKPAARRARPARRSDGTARTS